MRVQVTKRRNPTLTIEMVFRIFTTRVSRQTNVLLLFIIASGMNLLAQDSTSTTSGVDHKSGRAWFASNQWSAFFDLGFEVGRLGVGKVFEIHLPTQNFPT